MLFHYDHDDPAQQAGLLQLVWSGANPNWARSLIRSTGSPINAVDAVARGHISVSDQTRAVISVAAEQRLGQLSKLGIEPLWLGSGQYPAWLAETPNPPEVLFTRGSIPTRPGIAIVGSRKAKTRGLALAEKWGAALAERGAAVISGLAVGVDGAAHKGALRGEGQGVAVLPCGLDVWYPPVHRSLGEALLNTGGATISEYPPGMRPARWRFLMRNRIVVGLSKMVIVIEPAAKSGSANTIRQAREQRTPVVTIPSGGRHPPIDEILSGNYSGT